MYDVKVKHFHPCRSPFQTFQICIDSAESSLRSFAKLAKLIIALKKDKEGLQDVIAGLEVQNNELMLDRDKLISDTIKSPMLARKNSEEVIKTKSKAKGKKGPEMILKCEYPDCDNSNEDALIKCNSCSKWICESCSDIAIPKYKTISNKCQNVYFACNNCAKSSVDQGFILDSDSSPAVVTSTATASIASAAEGNTVTEKGDLVSTLTDLFDKKVLQIETKLEKLIESKLEVLSRKITLRLNQTINNLTLLKC